MYNGCIFFAKLDRTFGKVHLRVNMPKADSSEAEKDLLIEPRMAFLGRNPDKYISSQIVKS